jgi:hypothetical protein
MVRLRTLPLRGPLRRRTANDSSFFVMDSDILFMGKVGRTRRTTAKSHHRIFCVA